MEGKQIEGEGETYELSELEKMLPVLMITLVRAICLLGKLIGKKLRPRKVR
jgi:hypothetical protein